MSTPSPGPTVLQMRLVVEVDDFEAAVALHRNTLGLSEQAAYQGEGGARVIILDAGRATLELANAEQKQLIDRVEAGGRPSNTSRVAFEVLDTAAATQRLAAGGATLVADPVETPWRSLNSRLEGPGLQLTLFQELAPPS